MCLCAEPKKWKALVSTALAAAVITFSSDFSALADLNKFEADIRGEFGIGSAAQYGSADLKLVISSIESICSWIFRKSFFEVICNFFVQEGCSH